MNQRLNDLTNNWFLTKLFYHFRHSPIIVYRGRADNEGTFDAPFRGMQATQSPRKVFLPKHGSKKRLPKSAKSSNKNLTSYIGDEINAYGVIRDIALAEAEKEPTPLNLERARIANDFVENCLRPARTPYEAQNLPEAEATRERQRCEDAKVRIALLRAQVETVAHEQTEPAPAAVS